MPRGKSLRDHASNQLVEYAQKHEVSYFLLTNSSIVYIKHNYNNSFLNCGINFKCFYQFNFFKKEFKKFKGRCNPKTMLKINKK